MDIESRYLYIGYKKLYVVYYNVHELFSFVIRGGEMKFTRAIRMTILLLIPVIVLIGAARGGEEDPRTSYKYIVVYGTGDLEVGDVVEFYDREGTLCGKWEVRDEGAYGLMAVYGDDPTTEDVDEGAREGEELTIRVNGREKIAVGSPPVFDREGETRRVDL